jgi:outer membrane protein TolC
MFVLWTLLALFPLAAHAETLALNGALEIARAKNPDLKRMEIAVNAAAWKRLDALSGQLPHVSVDGTHYLDSKYGKMAISFGGGIFETPMAYPQTDISVEASLLLFDGFQTINRYRAACAEYEASESEYRHAKFRLDQEISIKFYRALAAQELAKVADQNIATLTQHLKLAHISRRAGAAVKFDTLRIESQLEEAKAEKLLADDNVMTARQVLFETLGIPTDGRALTGKLPVPSNDKVPEDLRLDVSSRDDVQAQLKREIAADRMDSAAAAFWLPKISVFGRKEWYKFGTFDNLVQPNDSFQEASAVGIRLTWELFDGGSSWAKKAMANDAYLQSRELSRKILLTGPGEFDSWKRKYAYNTALYLARLRTIEKSQESVRLSTISARAGVRTHSEVLDAELDLFRARAGAIHAQLEAAESRNNLELAVGHHL